MFGFDSHPWSVKILHFLDAQMLSRVDGGEHAKQLEGIDRADDTDIEQAVVHRCLRSDLHPAAVLRSVGEGREHGWLIAARDPGFRGDIRLRRRQDSHAEWSESENARSGAQSVAPMPAEPAR